MLAIKQLKSGGKVFFPQTVAEAVVVQDEKGINTLADTLQRKIEEVTVTDELTVTPSGTSVEITHTNDIDENSTPEPLQIQYNSKGHIIVTKPYGKLFIKVNDNEKEYSGATDVTLNFGDDFQMNQDDITLRWNNI